MSATIVIATLCITIEIYHLIYRSKINSIRKTVENALTELQTVDVNDYISINKILDNVPMSLLRKYFLMLGIEIVYWILSIGFIFSLHCVGVMIFLILMALSIISHYIGLISDNNIIFDTIDSIFCIAMYVVIIFMF